MTEAMISITISITRMDTPRMDTGIFIQTLYLASSRSNAITTGRKIKKKIINNRKKKLALNMLYKLRRRSLLSVSNGQTIR